jgi:hypothetical protein
MIKRITRILVGAGMWVLVSDHASAAQMASTLNWPLPLSVTVWLAGAGILAVVGFIGRKK